MDDERGLRAEQVLSDVLDLPTADRPAAVDAACAGDAALRAEVLALLGAAGEAAGFMADPTDARSRAADAATLGADPGPATAPVAERSGSRIGRYKLLEPIGEGGFGVVFRAEQEYPVRRQVALKVIKLGMDTREVVARFEAERQALALMDHPNIARVLDAGATDAGRPYFVMELVRGSPITDYCDRHRLSTRDRVALAAQVCRAVQHAHGKGVIHRDLKPSNVLVTTGDGDRPVPKVIDFGIAKATQAKLTDRTLYTAFRQMIGTPQYMSPEQADSDGTDVDTRTDVYSLGVVLYELLVGTTPLDARSLRSAAMDAMRRMIREVEPARPSTRLDGLGETAATVAANRGTELRKLGQAVRGELDWIVMRALEKDRGRRYDTAAALADDLGRYLAGEAVVAGPVSGWYRARTFARRHRTGIGVAAAAMLLVTAGVAGTTAGLVRERTAKLEGRASAYRADCGAAALALHDGDGPRFAHELAAAPPELRGWEWSWLDRQGTPRDRYRLASDPGERFTWLSLATDDRVGGESGNGTAVVWDLRSGQVLWRKPATCLQLSPAGGVAALVRTDRTLDLCDLETGQVRWHATALPGGRFLPYVETHGFAHDGSLVAIGNDGASGMTVFDVRSGRPTRFDTEYPTDPRFLLEAGVAEPVRDPRGRLFACGQRAGNLTVDLAADLTGNLTGDGSKARPRVCPNPREAAGWAFDSTTRFSITGVEPSVRDAVLRRHGVYALYAQSAGGLIEVPLPAGLAADEQPTGASARPVRAIVADEPVVALRATPDETRFVSLLQDGSVWVSPVDPIRRVAVPGEPRGLALSPDGSRVVSLGWGYVSCLDPVTGLSLWGRNVGTAFCHSAAWSPDGARVVVLADDEGGTVPSEAYVLDGQTGRPLEAWTRSPLASDGRHPAGPAPWAGPGVAAGLAFTPDGRFLRVGHLDGTVARVDTTSWQAVSQAKAVPLDLADAAARGGNVRGRLVPDRAGKRFVQVTLGGEFQRTLLTGLIVRSDEDDQPLWVGRLPGYAAVSAAWTPDGRSLAAGYAAAADACVRLLDASTGAERWRQAVPDGSAPSELLVTPDGSRVIALTNSLMVVYDASTGQVQLAAKSGDVPERAAMAPDGAVLTSTGGNGSLGSYQYGLLRSDAADPEPHLADVRRAWPAGLAVPASVADARRQVAAADAVLARYPTELRLPVDPAAAPLVAALRSTVEPNVNWYNSWALNLSMDPHATDAQRAGAEAAWRAAGAAVPKAFKVWINLGEMLFAEGRLAESYPPLSAAVDLMPAYGYDRDASAELKRAIAAHAAGRPNARELYQQAVDLAAQTPDPDGSLAPLVAQARQAFGG